MSVWYLARPDELLIDLDDAGRPTRTGAPWIEVFFRRRLRDAIADGKLRVRDVYLSPSNSVRHYHAIVRLGEPLPIMQRLVWQLHLGSDLYRGRADLMRAARGFDAPSLLIRSHPMIGFYREPDRVCDCTAKHITSDQPTCKVWRELRGMSPWELFGRSTPTQPERGVSLRAGKVDLVRLMIRNPIDGKKDSEPNEGGPPAHA
jgi:hypothetical protein